MKPNMMDRIQTNQAGAPTVAPMAPMENSTKAGTPLAIQKAPVQLIFRCNPPSTGTDAMSVVVVIVMDCSPLYGNRLSYRENLLSIKI